MHNAGSSVPPSLLAWYAVRWRELEAERETREAKLHEPKPPPLDPKRCARIANIPANNASFEVRACAFWMWWVPNQARQFWFKQSSRDTALWVLMRMAALLLPDTKPTAGDIDSSIDWSIQQWDAQLSIARVEVVRMLDAMLNAETPTEEIRLEIAEIAKRHNFADVSFDDVIRDRVGAWKWRQRHRRPA